MVTPLAPEDRVLVRVPSWLGDLVLAEPVLRALWTARGGREDALSFAGPAALLPLLDGVFPGARRIAHDGRGAERPADWRGHDVALLLAGSFRSAWTAWRAGIPRRVGQTRDGRGWLLTEGVRPALERGATPPGLGRHGRGSRFLPRPFGTVCVELALHLGLSVSDARPRLEVAPQTAEGIDARLARAGLAPGARFVLANAGGRTSSAKAWEPGPWARVLDLLAQEPGLPLVLVCGPGEEAALAAVLARVERARPLALVDPVATLAELAALCRRAALVLTTDSGPRHVASAVGAPVVCVLGPTDPRHTADHLEHTRLVREVVPCGPCHRELCPLTGPDERACLRAVDPARVVAAARELLEAGTRAVAARRPVEPLPSRA